MDFPLERYVSASSGAEVYEVDETKSLVQVLVYRSGRLARLGHDHVVAGLNVGGFANVAERGDRVTVTADLYQALGRFTVDDDELRQRVGFETEPSADDKENTRRNMLKSLESGVYPFVRIAVREGRLTVDEAAVLPIDITLHGVAQQFSVPVRTMRVDSGFNVTGSFKVLQSAFDVQPFSVLGGALAVQDELDVQFDIVFKPRISNSLSRVR